VPNASACRTATCAKTCAKLPCTGTRI